MWFQIQVPAYVSLIVAYALLLLLAIRHRIGHGLAQRLLEVALVTAGLWVVALGSTAFFMSGAWGGFVWHTVGQVGVVILALLTAEFAEAYVERPGRRWLWTGFVAVLVLLALLLDTVPIPWRAYLPFLASLSVSSAELAAAAMAFAWGIATTRAWWSGTRALRRVTGSKHRNRLRYLLTALVGFTVGDLLVLIGGIPDVYVGLAARLLGFSIVTFALLRYDLPDIKGISLSTFCVFVLSGFTALVYLVVLFLVGYLVGVVPNLSRLMVAVPPIALSFLLVAAADVVLRPRLRAFLDRTILGQNYNVQKALRTYSQQVNLILDLERLADTTLEWLRETLEVHRSAFILLTPQDEGRVQLKMLRAVNTSSPEPKTFGSNNRFLLHFHNLRRPLSQYDLDMLTWFKAMPADERQWLQQLVLDLYIPVLVADKPVALLALGPKAGGQPYSDEDLETLMTLAGQTGTALENARLVDDLRAVQDDLHNLGNQLTETNRQLKRLDQTKSDFIAIASHELRTPLTQIYGYSDILTRLKEDDLSDAQVVHQFIEGITRGANRLKRVVDAMVDVSLIETGSLKINPVTLPLGLIVENAIESVQGAAQERSLNFVVNDLSSLPYVQADSSRLEQAFVGLLNNAVKFTPDGGQILVSGRLTVVSPSDDCVELMFADSGIGIDSDQQALIFEKFHRGEELLHHSTDDVGFKGAGPGLGLAIVKGIVEAHGGRIWVESPGRDEERCPGSTFYVRLPVNGPGQA